jgi:hypothetical protein
MQRTTLSTLQSKQAMTPDKEAILSESWKRTLQGIPSLIGRLAYLASLRNINTGAYEHAGLSQRIGDTETDRLLRRSHHSVFGDWLCYGLERQKQEVEEYLSSLEGDRQGIIAHWLTIEPYAIWLPSEALSVERKLFNSDLSIVLELIRLDSIRNGSGAVSRDRDS